MEINRAIQRFHGASTVIEAAPPEPGPGEVILAPEAVSLCGTDLQMLRGLRDDPSPVLGHEGACRVVQLGAGVGAVSVGDRVTVNPTHPEDSSFLLGHNVDGLFQQRVRIARSAVDAGLLVPIGRVLDSATATLIEPLAVTDYALNCLALSCAGDCLVIVGDGLIGNLAAIRAVGRAVWSRVVLVHTSQAGLAWSAQNWPTDKAEHTSIEALPALLRGKRLGALIATHRDRTVPMIDQLAGHLRNELVALHITGGVPSPASSSRLPGIDLGAVRAVNTGGPWPPRHTEWRGVEGTVRLTGNRGVTSAALARAATDLEELAMTVAPLITHRTDLVGGAELMNRMVATRSRNVDGRLVIRLVVTVNPEFEL